MTGGRDGAEIRIYRDPLRPGDHQRHEVEPGRRLIDWLFETYPAGFGQPIILHLNGAPLPIADADVQLAPGDLVHILVTPAGQAVGALIVKALVTAAIAAVAQVAFNLIFKPKRPNAQETPAPDPIYSVSGAQNAARLGDPVPVLYGQMVTVPDFASQPYTFFDGNEQYLDQLLVIGQGEYTLGDVLLGETPASALESNAVQYWLIGPAQHNQTMGNIRALTGIMENVVTSVEVADQEITSRPTGDVVTQTGGYHIRAPNQIQLVSVPPPAGYPLVQITGSSKNDGTYTVAGYNSGTAVLTVVEGTLVDENVNPPAQLAFFHTTDQQATGPFITSKPGTVGDQLLFDFVWPGGLYEIDNDGNFLGRQVDFHLQYQQVDDAGTPIGAWQTVPISFAHNTNTPQRRTWVVNVAHGRYRARVRRITAPSTSANITDAFTWTGLKFRLLDSVGPVYGPVTFLAIRIRATNGIASAASSRIRADVVRKLPRLGSGPAVESVSPADAFVDVFTNQTYGGKRPLYEVDLAELTRIEASWQGMPQFNGGFAQRSTVWEALSLVLQTANAAPLPLGQIMSLAQEGVKATRRQLFTDANMTRGSLSIGYTFDKPGDYDGIRVEYRDPATWNSLYVTYPPGALDVDQVQLFGCSDATQAQQFAQLLWQKRLRLRKTASFETELEGLLARMGDRIGVSSELPRWAAGGVVVGQSGLTLWLDHPPDWTGAGHFVILRDQYGTPSDSILVTPGPEPATVTLAAPPPFPIFGTGGQEPTHYAFGNTVQLVRDFTVQSIEPRGGVLVGVEALAYDPAAFAGTLPWLMEPT